MIAEFLPPKDEDSDPIPVSTLWGSTSYLPSPITHRIVQRVLPTLFWSLALRGRVTSSEYRQISERVVDERNRRLEEELAIRRERQQMAEAEEEVNEYIKVKSERAKRRGRR